MSKFPNKNNKTLFWRRQLRVPDLSHPKRDPSCLGYLGDACWGYHPISMDLRRNKFCASRSHRLWIWVPNESFHAYLWIRRVYVLSIPLGTTFSSPNILGWKLSLSIIIFWDEIKASFPTCLARSARRYASLTGGVNLDATSGGCKLMENMHHHRPLDKLDRFASSALPWNRFICWFHGG